MRCNNWSLRFHDFTIYNFTPNSKWLLFTFFFFPTDKWNNIIKHLWPILKVFSGAVVENLSASHGLMGAYAIFFIGAGLIGIPAIILFALLDAHQRAARDTADA